MRYKRIFQQYKIRHDMEYPPFIHYSKTLISPLNICHNISISTWIYDFRKTGLPLPSVWKANIRGVDINLNYPAEWDKEKQEEIEQGITSPGPRDFGGDAPLSEPESKAMVDFTKAHNFRLVIAYHTQGEVIYWQFMNYAPPRALVIVNQFAAISGYAVEEGTYEAAYAGYKDWFLQEYRRPGYTIEVGKGINPIPFGQLPGIYRENEGILLLGAVI